MIERFGVERFILEVGATLVSKDQSGRLWRVDFQGQEDYAVLKVENGALEQNATRRRYFLRVPSMQSPRHAAAWTCGLSPGQYDVTVRM